MNEEEPASPCPGSWVSMAMRVRHQWPNRNLLHRDLMQMLPSQYSPAKEELVSSLKLLTLRYVLSCDNLTWHLACSCPSGMFDQVMEAMLKELAHRYRINSGQRLQYNLTRSIVRLSLHCIHSTLPLLQFLRRVAHLFDDEWFRWSSCRYHPADDVGAMWAFYAELADAMAVGYVVPRLYERKLPQLPHLDLSGIPRLRDSTWSLRTIYDAGNKELNPLLVADKTLQLTLDLEVEGMDHKQLRLLHKLAMDRRKCEGGTEQGGRFLVGVKHLYVTSLSVWGTLMEDVLAFPELCHVTLNMCGVTADTWADLAPLATRLTGLALPNNPDLSDLEPLTQYTKLQVLDLSNIDLRGRLDPINQLSTSLEYLGVSGCRLQAADLMCLATSKHCESLLNLDVSENSALAKPDMYQAYMELFAALKKVSVLNLSHCHLAEYSEDQRGSVEAAIRAMTTLQLIAFSSKDFPAGTQLQGVIYQMDCKLFYML